MTETDRPGHPTAPLAWGAAAVAMVAAAVATWLAAGGGPADGNSAAIKLLVLTAIWVVPGVLIARARPGIPLGWLALGQAVLSAASGLADQWLRHGAGSDGGADVAWAAWVTDRFSALLAVGLWLLLVLLPDGRLPSPRWRPLVGLVVAVQCAALLAFSTVRGPAAGPDTAVPERFRDVANPVGVLPERVGDWLAGMDGVLLQLPLLLCLAVYVVRLRRAGPDERVRVVGVLLAASTAVLLVVVGHAAWPQAADALDVAAGALLAAQLTATVLERRPRVVGMVVRQTFVYTVLVAAIGGVAVLASTVLRAQGQDLPGFGIAVLAGGLALALHPLRVRLARIVDRLLYGDLHDPYRALQRLAEETHRAPTAEAVLAGLAGTVAASLRVPWCAAEAGGHLGSWGDRPPGGVESTAALLSGATTVGTVTVACGPGRRLVDDEVRLLAELGRHGGIAVQAVLLTDALRAGRQRLVVAREEERRRLRRDLHDGVGPSLAGITMQLGAVRPLVRSEPDAVADRLGRLQEAARDALVTVRRLSHGLRPPALDELGLDGALRQLAESLGLRPRFVDPEPPRLPAAVEVAGYLIAAEALHNVARHAGTDDVEISVRVEEDEATLRIRDAGTGLAGTGPAGIGLDAMRERADELGGSVVVDFTPGQGTTVCARLPTRALEAEVLA